MNLSSVLEFLITRHLFLPDIKTAKVSHVREASLSPQHILETSAWAPAPSTLALTTASEGEISGVFPQGTVGHGFKWPLQSVHLKVSSDHVKSKLVDV